MENNKILIVEDDLNLGKVLLEYLSMKGFDTDIAENGEIGLKKFLNQQYDFVVLDIMMPKKDGFSLAQDIRKIDDKIPIIFLTAKSQKENILKAFKISLSVVIAIIAINTRYMRLIIFCLGDCVPPAIMYFFY